MDNNWIRILLLSLVAKSYVLRSGNGLFVQRKSFFICFFTKRSNMRFKSKLSFLSEKKPIPNKCFSSEPAIILIQQGVVDPKLNLEVRLWSPHSSHWENRLLRTVYYSSLKSVTLTCLEKQCFSFTNRSLFWLLPKLLKGHYFFQFPIILRFFSKPLK